MSALLSPDLIATRRRGDELKLAPLSAADRERAIEIAQEILYALGGLLGSTEEEVELCLGGIECTTREKKLKTALERLALSNSTFEAPTELAPVELRRMVFEEAARARAEMREKFDRKLVLSQVGERVGATREELERALFSDLKGAAELRAAPALSAEALVAMYEEAQLLGVFLRAVRVRARLRLENPAEVRTLFWKLKFRELLFRLEERGPGEYELQLEGPSSLLVSSTRYGLRFSQVIGAVIRAGATSLEADVLWGKSKRPLTFRHAPRPIREGAYDAEDDLRPELSALLESPLFEEKGIWVARASSLLHVPGLGVVVPDLEFRSAGSAPVFFELLGETSREAAFKRADWARQNPSSRVIFAASSRLRVSPEIFEGVQGSRLLVYPGSLTPKKVLVALQDLL
ncbi:MAG: hypothetical protein B6A08_13430 [Sorangiineae bacterium NIC37A_2]|jgi:predicted nuclease of restriction endonuclease-like RecB superfamily|nr:MAG: hypothetical protein B6A08_13430 [Sorangiineae bacterium NIC37A_2]